MSDRSLMGDFIEKADEGAKADKLGLLRTTVRRLQAPPFLGSTLANSRTQKDGTSTSLGSFHHGVLRKRRTTCLTDPIRDHAPHRALASN